MGVRRPPLISPRRKVLSALVALAFSGATLANPTGPAVVSGAASFATAGKTLTVTNTPSAILNWQGFSIARDETTRFVQQSAASAVLNRVVGQDPSAILGTLSSNGRVFLLNPNGIVFGAGSVVNVAGLVASTLNLSNQDFLAGRLNFTTDATAGSIVNHGSIATPSGGRVYLIAPNVENHGVISTPQGQTILAAGRSVQLVEADVPNLRVEVQAGGEALNVGQIIADGGAAGIYAGLINQRGIVRADSATRDAARNIVFRASGRTMLEAGSLTSASGEQGGRIEITGEEIGLIGNARVEAKGEKGGGTVLVGGDYQGKNADVPNARATYIGPDATIDASATQAGDGGKVIVWADEVTRYLGRIFARGGARGGDGGFVEISGKQALQYAGTADTRAPLGRAGTLVLDPPSINIFVATADINGDSIAGDDLTTPNLLFADYPSGSSITAGAISGQLATSNVVLQSTGFIGFDVNTDVNYTGSAPRTLTLEANIDVSMGGGAQIRATGTGALSVTLNSDADGVGGGAISLGNGVTTTSISTQGGNILLAGGPGAVGSATGAGASDLGIFLGKATLDAGSGSITLRGLGRQTLLTVPAVGVKIQQGSALQTTTGNIMVTGTGGRGTTGSDYGVWLTGTGTSISTTSGTISINGTGAAVPCCSNNYGINIESSAAIQSTTGAISLTGIGGAGASNNIGVRIISGIIQTLNGNIVIQGTGGPSGSNSRGIEIRSGGIVSASAGGTIVLTGQGGNGTFNNYGVWVDSGTVTSNSGAITIVGTGAGSGLSNRGIVVVAPVTSGTGNITFIGQGAAGTNNNWGVEQNNDVISSGGSISITGTSAGTGTSNYGIAGNPATIQTTGSGSITLTGQGGPGTTNNYGVYWGGLTVSAVNGAIIVNGTGGGSVDDNYGLYINAGSISATGSGSIQVNGSGAATAPGIKMLAGTVGGASHSGDLILRARTASGADSIALAGTVNGTGNVFLEPLDAGTTIGLGGGAGTFNLSSAELGTIANGFSQLTIGHPTGTGLITVGTHTFNDPIIIRNTGTGSAGIVSSGTLAAGANDLSLLSAGNVNISQGTASGANIGITAGSLIVQPGVSATSSSLVNATGNLTVNANSVQVRGSDTSAGLTAKLQAAGAIDITAGSVSIEGGDANNASAAIDPAGITINATGNVTLQGGIGNEAYALLLSPAGNIALTAGGTISLQQGTGLNANAGIVAEAGMVTMTAPACVGCGGLSVNPWTGTQLLQSGVYGSGGFSFQTPPPPPIIVEIPPPPPIIVEIPVPPPPIIVEIPVLPLLIIVEIPVPPPPPQVLPPPQQQAGAPPAPDPDSQPQSDTSTETAGGTTTFDVGSGARKRRAPRCG